MRCRLGALAAVAGLVLALPVGASEHWPRLVGTAPDASGGGLAVFEDGAGRQAVRRLGEDVGGLRVVAVRRGEADLADGRGGRLTLRMRGGPLVSAGAPRGRSATASERRAAAPDRRLPEASPGRADAPGGPETSPARPAAYEHGPAFQSAKPILSAPFAASGTEEAPGVRLRPAPPVEGPARE
jgi:hypothetical protein